MTEMYEPENLERWTTPQYYLGAQWHDYYVFLGRHRDSDFLGRSNFICALEELGGESETVIVARASHWSVGWRETILIHESDEKALRLADDMVTALENYPVLNEYHLSELEWNEARDHWENMSVRDRVEVIKKYAPENSIFAARRDELPEDYSGALLDYLRS